LKTKAWEQKQIDHGGKGSFVTCGDRGQFCSSRLAVSLVFVTQGILKFTDVNTGVNRFTRIGFSHPYFTAQFVGSFEVICGFLILIGLFTRVAAVPLLIVIFTAIATTKIPELSRANQGFWFMVSDARTDFAMLMSLLFLLRSGAGLWSCDALMALPKR
jgi:uncharacterized membrane protein YphA (DoxX/SURF4 family)